MWTAIINWVTGGALEKLTGSLERAYTAKLAAQTDSEKLEAEKQIAFFEGQVALATAAAQNDKWWSTRELMGKIAFLFYAKIAFWDTVLQFGSTPDPGPLVKGITMTIIGFYFGSKALGDTAGKILTAIKK